MSRDRQDDEDRRGRAFVAAHERLVDALAADLIGAPDGEVLASHTPGAARVAADTLRRRLIRDAPAVPAGAGSRDLSPDPAPPPSHRPERKP